MFRSLYIFATGAPRSLERNRLPEVVGELPGPLGQVDRYSCDWKTVSIMLHMMRECGFLNVNHRGSEWLCKVFCTPQPRLNIKTDHDNILYISERGKMNSKNSILQF